MEKIKMKSKIFILSVLFGSVLNSSCKKDLLNQVPTTDLAASVFWKTPADATTALMGAYAAVRPCFDRDYYFDGQGEYVRTRSGTNSTTSGNLRLGDAYNNGNYNPTGYGSSFDKMYMYLYGAVNRSNYVIENVNKMLETASPSNLSSLDAIVGEARLLRG
ncbi:MAG: RagB/SusD family nutrient uptake outer membrane protein, partial [Ginsengibacter sp.]